ncbi:MAG: hypothetical protein QW292_13950 [Candidatus Parvarchaeota archaeon]
MNPTVKYHAPLKYFLENSCLLGIAFTVDARRNEYLRKMMNLSKGYDLEDVHILAAVLWRDKKYGKG